MNWRLATVAVACWVAAGNAAAAVSSSSALRDGKEIHEASRAFDGDLATSWVENAAGSGIGEWIEVVFRRPQHVESATVFGGVFTDPTTFFAYNHLKAAHLVVRTPEGTSRIDMTFPDAYRPVTVRVGLEVKAIRLVIDQIHAGSLYSDTAVSEIAFNLGHPMPEVVSALERWKQGPRGRAAIAGAESALETARTQVEQGEIAAARILQDAARRGLAPVRARLAQLVEPGFLLAHIEPCAQAVEALKSLRLAGSAGALEQAALIVPDPASADYLRRVASYIRAWNAFMAPRRSRLPSWGVTGIEPGALSGKGEPLAIAVSRAGKVFVCDMGNNRVQRFSDMGRAESVTGGAPGLAETFLGRTQAYYVVGAQPGIGPGLFTQPLAITLVETRDDVLVVVVDAERRLQVLDSNLKPLETWTVDSDTPILGGVGIAGPALVAKRNRIMCLWGHDAFVYDLRGNTLSTFSLEVAVRTAVLWHGRIIVHGGGRELRKYGMDGFDYGPFARIDDSQFLEDLDLAVGPDGSLYVHTDLGKLLKFNRRGRLRGTFTTFGKPVPNARVAVGADMVYVTWEDHIHRFPLP